MNAHSPSRNLWLPIAALSLVLGACARDKDPSLVGSLEWDRIAVNAELAEPVLRWAVAEGDRVEAGAVLLELDGRRQDARIAEAHGSLMQAEGRLSELAHGARVETIEAQAANLASARAAEIDAENEFKRVSELRTRELVAASALDTALATRNQRRAATKAAEAQLRELTQGTRPEQVDQAAAAVDAAKATLNELQLTRDRLTIRAPRAGRVDSLPFRPGDQPPVGAALVSLLVGDTPYARVFVPAPRRAEVQPGAAFQVSVEGDKAYPAKLRSIRSEPSFTPYYALTGEDASRLVYRAELLLDAGDGVADLPAGLPVTVKAGAP